MIRAVIFDMDGTLTNSVKAHSHATTWVIEKISNELGYVKPKGYKKFVYKYFGKDYRSIIREHTFPRISDKTNKKYEKMRNRYLIEHNLSYVTRFRGAKSILKFLKKRKIKIAVASSSSGKEISAFMKKTSLKKYITKIVGRDEVEHAKPNPDMLYLACKKLRLNPDEVVYVGDSEYDAIACKRSKIRFVAVTTGQLSYKQARKYTKNVFDNLFEVKKYLDSFI